MDDKLKTELSTQPTNELIKVNLKLKKSKVNLYKSTIKTHVDLHILHKHCEHMAFETKSVTERMMEGGALANHTVMVLWFALVIFSIVTTIIFSCADGADKKDSDPNSKVDTSGGGGGGCGGA